MIHSENFDVELPQELQGHNYKVVYFTPDELEVDMTIDPNKIVTLMNSIKADGKILEPIFIWCDHQKVYHIINGMHRTYSAKQLSAEMPNLLIPAVIIDCSEKTFREARVIAASPHIAIREERINEWIREAWQSSEFGKDASATLLSSAYGVYQKNGKFSNQKVQEWFERNSQLWGYHIDVLAFVVLGSYRTENGKKIRNESLLNIASEHELSPHQYVTLVENAPASVGRKGTLTDRESIKSYVEDVIKSLPIGENPIPLADYQRQKYALHYKQRNSKSKPVEEIEQSDKKDNHLQSANVQRWVQTVSGSKNFVDFLSRLLPIDYELLFAERPHTKSQIAEILGAAAALSRKVYNTVDPSTEVILLRRENERLKRANETLSKEYSRFRGVQPSNLALSSTDIEMSSEH